VKQHSGLLLLLEGFKGADAVWGLVTGAGRAGRQRARVLLQLAIDLVGESGIAFMQ
jgi:hypothetical protein